MSVFIPRWSRRQTGPSTGKTGIGTSGDQISERTGAHRYADQQACKTGITSLGSHSAGDQPACKTGKTSFHPEEAHDLIEDMSLEAFAEAGLILRIWSALLEQEVVFVSDNVPPEALAERGVVYRAQELQQLAKADIDQAGLRAVHEIKSVFGGSILGDDLLEARSEEPM